MTVRINKIIQFGDRMKEVKESFVLPVDECNQKYTDSIERKFNRKEKKG